MYKYYAFGLTIESEYALPQVPEIDSVDVADVKIVLSELTAEDVPVESEYIRKNDVRFCVANLARFRITNGNLIEVYPLMEDYSRLAIFLMGSCMGAILHQRGELPLHGSCITNGADTILITGDSGAGKSTLASVFMRHGWRLLTDDVAVVKDTKGSVLIQPSYPSQKLWENSPEMNDKTETDIHAVYIRGSYNKLGVSVQNAFQTVPQPLTMIIRLIAGEADTQIMEVERFSEIDQIMRNTYRGFMIMREDLERHFQSCVDIACRVPMILAVRNVNEESRNKLYSLITDRLQKKSL